MVVASIKDCRADRRALRLTPVAAPDKAQARVGRLAQLVERFVYTEDVGGSNPSPPTISSRCQVPEESAASMRARISSDPGSTPEE